MSLPFNNNPFVHPTYLPGLSSEFHSQNVESGGLVTASGYHQNGFATCNTFTGQYINPSTSVPLAQPSLQTTPFHNLEIMQQSAGVVLNGHSFVQPYSQAQFHQYNPYATLQYQDYQPRISSQAETSYNIQALHASSNSFMAGAQQTTINTPSSEDEFGDFSASALTPSHDSNFVEKIPSTISTVKLQSTDLSVLDDMFGSSDAQPSINNSLKMCPDSVLVVVQYLDRVLEQYVYGSEFVELVGLARRSSTCSSLLEGQCDALNIFIQIYRNACDSASSHFPDLSSRFHSHLAQLVSLLSDITNQRCLNLVRVCTDKHVAVSSRLPSHAAQCNICSGFEFTHELGPLLQIPVDIFPAATVAHRYHAACINLWMRITDCRAWP